MTSRMLVELLRRPSDATIAFDGDPPTPVANPISSPPATMALCCRCDRGIKVGGVMCDLCFAFSVFDEEPPAS